MSNLAPFNRKISPQVWSRRHFNELGQLNHLPMRAQTLRVIGDLRSFKRKESIPPQVGKLWMVEQGLVKILRWNETGESSLLGLWSQGELVAQPLAAGIAYQIECITPVKVRPLLLETVDMQVVMSAQIRQMEFLLELMHCHPILQRTMKFLGWLAQKGGCVTEQGCMIDLNLTHEAIAEMVGTTRVTITRLLQQLEAEGQLIRLHRHRILLFDGWQAIEQDMSLR
jgi:CRP-like cAMP-binding protein